MEMDQINKNCVFIYGEQVSDKNENAQDVWARAIQKKKISATSVLKLIGVDSSQQPRTSTSAYPTLGVPKEMDDIEVDPELFNMCRLCVVQKGKFLLMPQLRDQLKFCFGITVEPGDRLSPLLCADCKGKLADFSGEKERFIERQTSLLTKKAVLANGRVEIDQERWSLCRLCIQKQGKFLCSTQDTEDVQFCYDVTISIDFDGLPQLICAECEAKLAELYNMKKTYIESQAYLLDRSIKKGDASDIQLVSVTSQAEETVPQPASHMQISTDETTTAEPHDASNLNDEPPNYENIEYQLFRLTSETTFPFNADTAPQPKEDASVTKEKVGQSRKSSAEESTASSASRRYIYPCEFCNKSYKSSFYVEKHVKKEHQKIQKILLALCPRSCEVLSSFWTVQQLQQSRMHMSTMDS